MKIYTAQKMAKPEYMAVVSERQDVPERLRWNISEALDDMFRFKKSDKLS